MSKKNRSRSTAEEEKVASYRCPNTDCKHAWKGAVNWNKECPKCGELQGPVSIL